MTELEGATSLNSNYTREQFARLRTYDGWLSPCPEVDEQLFYKVNDTVARLKMQVHNHDAT